MNGQYTMKNLKKFLLSLVCSTLFSFSLTADSGIPATPCPKLTGTDFSNLTKNNHHIKNWILTSTSHANIEIADPKTISVQKSQDYQANGVCKFKVMKHKESEYGPHAKPDLVPTDVTFILTRERAFCPSITTDTLNHLQHGEAILFKDPENRAQPDGVMLKAVDENAAKNIKIALRDMPNKTFSTEKTTVAEPKGGLSDVCTYKVDSNGIQDIWLHAYLQD